MSNVNGLRKFKDFFENYPDNYVIIGGTACSIIFEEVGENFRTTKDIDLVVIVECMEVGFGNRLWDFIKSAQYDIECGVEKRNFYRFRNPKVPNYPYMIELFSRFEGLLLHENQHIIPIHIAQEASSLSAILLDDDYYNLLKEGRKIVDGLSVLDERYLIPFKAKAWCELVERRKLGETGQSRHILKHCRDVSNLVKLLPANTKVSLEGKVREDMEIFVNHILDGEFVPNGIDVQRLHDILVSIYL